MSDADSEIRDWGLGDDKEQAVPVERKAHDSNYVKASSKVVPNPTAEDLEHRHEAALQRQTHLKEGVQKIIKAVRLTLGWVCLILVGGGLFHVLEYNHAEETNKALLQANSLQAAKIAAYFNHNDTVVAFLRDNGMPALQEDSFENVWGFSSSFFYAFTIATTIGYGAFAPVTSGGKIITVVYGILSIPLSGAVLVSLSKMTIHFFTYLYLLTIDQANAAFNTFDKDHDGHLTRKEVMLGLKDLDIHIDDEGFDDLMRKVDINKDGKMSRSEFHQTAKLLHADLSTLTAGRAQIKISILSVAIWVLFGCLFFQFGATYNVCGDKVSERKLVDTLYYAFITLSTIGLGDCYAKGTGDRIFLYFFSLAGLGMLAVFVNLVHEIERKMEKKTKQAMARSQEATKKQINKFQSVVKY